MKHPIKMLIVTLLTGACLMSPFFVFAADRLKVAVAANFTAAAKMISKEYGSETGEKVVLAFGSTGKLYAQIKNGAPFDMFLSADVQRPALLEKEGVAVSGSRKTYAMGRLILWSSDPAVVDPNGDALEKGDYDFIAIANPKLAPYGISSIEVLKSRGIWDQLSGKVVQGENLTQAYQYVISGNAQMGFIAYSQIRIPGKEVKGSFWLIPEKSYTPIEQQMVILKDSPATWRFWRFILGSRGKEIIETFGYGVR